MIELLGQLERAHPQLRGWVTDERGINGPKIFYTDDPAGERE